MKPALHVLAVVALAFVGSRQHGTEPIRHTTAARLPDRHPVARPRGRVRPGRLPASWVVLPFAGVGAGLRTNHGERMLWPLMRAGVDLQPWKWLAPRAQLEWTRYPDQGSVLLLSAGLRIGLPLHSRP